MQMCIIIPREKIIQSLDTSGGGGGGGGVGGEDMLLHGTHMLWLYYAYVIII